MAIIQHDITTYRESWLYRSKKGIGEPGWHLHSHTSDESSQPSRQVAWLYSGAEVSSCWSDPEWESHARCRLVTRIQTHGFVYAILGDEHHELRRMKTYLKPLYLRLLVTFWPLICSNLSECDGFFWGRNKCDGSWLAASSAIAESWGQHVAPGQSLVGLLQSTA